MSYCNPPAQVFIISSVHVYVCCSSFLVANKNRPCSSKLTTRRSYSREIMTVVTNPSSRQIFLRLVVLLIAWRWPPIHQCGLSHRLLSNFIPSPRLLWNKEWKSSRRRTPAAYNFLTHLCLFFLLCHKSATTSSHQMHNVHLSIILQWTGRLLVILIESEHRDNWYFGDEIHYPMLATISLNSP